MPYITIETESYKMTVTDKQITAVTKSTGSCTIFKDDDLEGIIQASQDVLKLRK